MDENTFGDFYKAEFDIDEFLNKQTENNELKDILYSLNDMKNRNANKMTTVLREKTDAVILIAEQLQSLYKKIDNLQSPLLQLKEEVLILANRVYKVVHSFDLNKMYSHNVNKTKENLTAIRAYKVVLLHTHQLMKSFMNQDEVDFEGMERLICKYAFHAFVLNQLNIKDTDAKRPSIDMSIKLILRDTFIKAHKAGNANRITRIIDMFVYLDMLNMLREIVCDDIIKPKVAPIFCEENLKACGNDMSLVYGQALRILERDLKILINIIRDENIDLDIVIDCYWNVVDKLLRTNLLSITAAGHPDGFFKHFNNTHKFLKEIGTIYGREQLYKENASFIEHLKRFNLLVYYEIRHQYVSSSFELVVLKCSEFSDPQQLESVCTTKNNALKLKVSLALDVLIDYLLSENVFIQIISEQFIKSILLLTSRYATWVMDCLMASLRKFPKCHELIALSVSLINDLQMLTHKLTLNYIKMDAGINESIRHGLREKFQDDFTLLYKEVSDFLVKYHLDKIKEDLKNVSDIPRLYRKTNRSMPQKASPYVQDAFKDVKILSQMFTETKDNVESRKVLFSEEHKTVLHELLLCTTREYNDMVRSVLNAVFKTEESLKRLKSRNVGTSDSGGLQGSSDEAKIRLQIKLDVQQFVRHVREFKLEELEDEIQGLLIQIENC